MAKYQIFDPAFVHGKYFEASVRNPQEIEVGDDVEPSTRWKPIDDAALAALEALDKKKVAAAEEARNAALNPKAYVPPVPKLPKRELVKTTAGEEAATALTRPSTP
jgi:hypothetical protein